MDANRTEILIYRVWRFRLLLGLAVVLVVIGGWQLYELGKAQSGGDGGAAFASLRAERDNLRQRTAELETRSAELERQLAMLERGRQVDQQAYDVFRQESSGLQDEISGLREELAFYRGILAPAQNKVGLEAQNFDIESALGVGRYRYRFMLTQSGRNEQLARGKIQFTLEGLQDNATKQLGLTELSQNGDRDIAYRFRYFQAIEGDLQLPDGFVPERVVLKAIPASAPRLPLEWTFDWPTGTSGSGEEN